MKKNAQRDANTARALAVCSKVRTPPALPPVAHPHTGPITIGYTVPQLASAQCKKNLKRYIIEIRKLTNPHCNNFLKLQQMLSVLC